MDHDKPLAANQLLAKTRQRIQELEAERDAWRLLVAAIGVAAAVPQPAPGQGKPSWDSYQGARGEHLFEIRSAADAACISGFPDYLAKLTSELRELADQPLPYEPELPFTKTLGGAAAADGAARLAEAGRAAALKKFAPPSPTSTAAADVDEAGAGQ